MDVVIGAGDAFFSTNGCGDNDYTRTTR